MRNVRTEQNSDITTPLHFCYPQTTNFWIYLATLITIHVAGFFLGLQDAVLRSSKPKLSY